MQRLVAITLVLAFNDMSCDKVAGCGSSSQPSPQAAVVPTAPPAPVQSAPVVPAFTRGNGFTVKPLPDGVKIDAPTAPADGGPGVHWIVTDATGAVVARIREKASWPDLARLEGTPNATFAGKPSVRTVGEVADWPGGAAIVATDELVSGNHWFRVERLESLRWLDEGFAVR